MWPTIDTLDSGEYDVSSLLFFAILRHIFDRLIRDLHLGPLCSSFSMVVNRFKTFAMRSAQQLGGFDNPSPQRKEKVRLGNALAEISNILVEAQEKAGNDWTLEQPAPITIFA